MTLRGTARIRKLGNIPQLLCQSFRRRFKLKVCVKKLRELDV